MLPGLIATYLTDNLMTPQRDGQELTASATIRNLDNEVTTRDLICGIRGVTGAKCKYQNRRKPCYKRPTCSIASLFAPMSTAASRSYATCGLPWSTSWGSWQRAIPQRRYSASIRFSNLRTSRPVWCLPTVRCQGSMYQWIPLLRAVGKLKPPKKQVLQLRAGGADAVLQSVWTQRQRAGGDVGRQTGRADTGRAQSRVLYHRRLHRQRWPTR